MNRQNIAKGLWIFQLVVELLITLYVMGHVSEQMNQSNYLQCVTCNVAPAPTLWELVTDNYYENYVAVWLPMLVFSIVGTLFTFRSKWQIWASPVTPYAALLIKGIYFMIVAYALGMYTVRL